VTLTVQNDDPAFVSVGADANAGDERQTQQCAFDAHDARGRVARHQLCWLTLATGRAQSSSPRGIRCLSSGRAISDQRIMPECSALLRRGCIGIVHCVRRPS
jgi:hypothetical protein